MYWGIVKNKNNLFMWMQMYVIEMTMRDMCSRRFQVWVLLLLLVFVFVLLSIDSLKVREKKRNISCLLYPLQEFLQKTKDNSMTTTHNNSFTTEIETFYDTTKQEIECIKKVKNYIVREIDALGIENEEIFGKIRRSK